MTTSVWCNKMVSATTVIIINAAVISLMDFSCVTDVIS